MNKKTKNVTDKTAPYRTLSFNKITAPNKTVGDPVSRVIKSDNDLRVRGGKS